jgi:hypothetical protein
MNRASESTCSGDNPANDVGRKKKIALRAIVSTPSNDPQVPGALRQWPTPNAVAIAYAIAGLFPMGVAGDAAASVVGVIGIRQVGQFFVIFIENGLRDDIFLRRPIA